MRYSDDPSGLGSKLGPKIAQIVADAIIASNRGLTQHKHDVGMAVFHSASDQISGEVHDVLGPVLGWMLDQEVPDEFRRLIEQFHHEHGQLTALAGTQIVGAVLGGAITPLINSGLFGITAPILAAGQSTLPPDTGVLASLIAKGIGNENDTSYDMQGQGLRRLYVPLMAEAARVYPDALSLLDPLRRGTVSKAAVQLAMQRNGIPGQYWGAILELAEVPLSPPDAALAVLRGNISQSQGAAFAAKYGVNASDFNLLILNTGEPPGLMQMLEAYRRGFINQGTLQKGIRESRVRDEWIPMVEQLRYSPMSTADAVQGVIQNHLPEAEAAKIAEQNGLEPGQISTLIQNAGEPLAHGQLAELFNRGLISKAFFDQGILESRLKNKYLTPSFELRTKLPSIYQIIQAVKAGYMTEARGVQIMLENGYEAQTSKEIILGASAGKRATSKNLAVGTITGLYEDRAISRAEALKLITGLKYSEQDAVWELELADLRARLKVITAAVNGVRSKYIARHIGEGEASVLLDEIGIASAQRDLYLRMWGIERKANVRVLSEAQVAKAVKLTLITPDEGLTRLVDMGYSEPDARLLIEGA